MLGHERREGPPERRTGRDRRTGPIDRRKNDPASYAHFGRRHAATPIRRAGVSDRRLAACESPSCRSRNATPSARAFPAPPRSDAVVAARHRLQEYLPFPSRKRLQRFAAIPWSNAYPRLKCTKGIDSTTIKSTEESQAANCLGCWSRSLARDQKRSSRRNVTITRCKSSLVIEVCDSISP